MSLYCPYLKKNSLGFSLLELVIVFAIITLLLGFAIPGLLKFNKGEALKSSASDLKSNLRYAQDSAISGKKEHPLASGVTVCSPNSTLLGYYISFKVNNTSFSVSVKCGFSVFNDYTVRTYAFPQGVTVKRLNPAPDPLSGSTATVLFKPVDKGLRFVNGSSALILPDDSNNWNISSLEIVLTNGDNDYSVIIGSSGEIYEKKQ